MKISYLYSKENIIFLERMEPYAIVVKTIKNAETSKKDQEKITIAFG